MGSPDSKKPRLIPNENEENQNDGPLKAQQTYSTQLLAPTPLPAPTPKPFSAGSLMAASPMPSLLPSQPSPMRSRSPRSPNRSPKKIELIQLSPIKSNKQELAKIYQERKEPVERLVIERLVLTNFKSYAGVQVVGPFHSSFSAVVGPNGSGKSNVIDSMLFVFGFRANKMRQSKLSELIHNSEAHPDLKECSVDVHFVHVVDELDGTTTVKEDSGLCVTRRAFRDNSSKYYINGKESTYTEVTNLLKAKGIDLQHKRFLILQGEVESIAQMKPKAEKENDDGLLEYLEDIIGTSAYKASIEEHLLKIETLNEVCVEKESRFEHVEKEKDALETQKTAAMEFLNKEKDLTIKKSILYQHSIMKNKDKISIEQSKVDEIKEKLQTEREKHEKLQLEVKELENQFKNASKELEEHDSTFKKMTDKQRSVDRERVSLEEKKKSLEKKKKKAESLMQTAERAISEADHKLQQLQLDDTAYEQQMDTLKSQLNEEKSVLEGLRMELTDKTKDISDRIAVHQKEIQPWHTQIEGKKTEIKLAQAQVQMFIDEREKSRNELKTLSNGIESMKNQTAISRERLNELESEKMTVAKKIEKGEAQLGMFGKELDRMKQDVSSLRNVAAEARATMSNVENKSRVLNGLSRLQQSGRITGFHGRLGDLGTINDKYDVAISTACPRLDDIVVDTVEVGQQCIEYLRKNKLGYARFILLDKLRNFNLSPIQSPAPRLFDLVNMKDKKFAPAFYSVLRDTLVADNLNEANKVAYGSKRYRVVTLDGKLIDISGTMTGGGHHVSRGLMKSKAQVSGASPEEVKKLELELKQKEMSLQESQQAYDGIEEVVRKLRDREPDIDTEITKCQLELQSLATDISNSEARHSELQVQGESEFAEKEHVIKENNDKIKVLQIEQSQLKESSKVVQDKIDSLQEEIMRMGGVELKMQQSKVDSLISQIDIATSKHKKDKTVFKKTQTELTRFKKSLQESITEISTCDTEMLSICDHLQEKTKLLDQLTEELEATQDIRQEKVDVVEKLKQELAEKSVSDFKSLEIEMENELEAHATKLKQEQHKLNKNVEMLGSLQIRDITLVLQLDGDGDINVDGLREVPKEELETLNIGLIQSEIEELEEYVAETRVDIEVLEEYTRRLTEFTERKQELNAAVEERDTMKSSCEELKKRRLDEFMEGFNVISMTLKEMYQMITLGGNAELDLVDSLDPFSEGILFSVMPPKKSWKNISNLSGGEKTLSSLALVFALHKYKPTPLYVMDEIDAALDFRNVSIIANYIKDRTKNAQFIVISLRNNMFELAQRLVGIYKVENMTKSTTLENREM